jgi:hypothetical protein
MNKTKRVAWHKHLKKAKKRTEKAHAEQQHATASHPGQRQGVSSRR